MDAVGEQHVEVALGHVGAGVADLVGPPAAVHGALDLARRAGVDADAVRRCRARRARGRPRGPRAAGWPSARTGHRYGRPVRARAAWSAAGILGEPGPVVDEQRRPVLAGERLGVRPTIRRRPSSSMSRPGRTHQGPVSHARRRCVAADAVRRASRSGPRRRAPASSDPALPRRRRRASPAAGSRPLRSRRSPPRRPSALRADGTR